MTTEDNRPRPMTAIYTATDRQTHDACYRLVGQRARVQLRSRPGGEFVTGMIHGSAWRERAGGPYRLPIERGLALSLDDGPTVVIPFGDIQKIILEP